MIVVVKVSLFVMESHNFIKRKSSEIAEILRNFFRIFFFFDLVSSFVLTPLLMAFKQLTKFEKGQIVNNIQGNETLPMCV